MDFEINAGDTFNVLEAARTAKNDPAVVFASTSEVYGDPEVNPQPESYRGNVDPYGPRSCYDESKRYGESLIRAYRDEHDLDVWVARIFNTYGPRMRLDDGRVIPTFMRQALTGDDVTVYGDGSQTRSFCYVSDLVDGLERLLQSDVQTPINIGNPDERFWVWPNSSLISPTATATSPTNHSRRRIRRCENPTSRKPRTNSRGSRRCLFAMDSRAR